MAYGLKPTTELDGKRILDRALSRVWALDLNYNQNSVTLVFSALNYFRPQQTYYRVRMKGLDDEWRILSPYSDDGMVDENGLLHLPLMGIQPGEYELEVQASMSPNDWAFAPGLAIMFMHGRNATDGDAAASASIQPRTSVSRSTT